MKILLFSILKLQSITWIQRKILVSPFKWKCVCQVGNGIFFRKREYLPDIDLSEMSKKFIKF